MQKALDQVKIRERSKQAISLAMESKWEEAAAVNREILEELPENTEALNRLGKALSELGRYSEARQALEQVLRLQPSNTIAKKNIERIRGLRDTAPRAHAPGVPPHFFIEETGKTGVTSLIDLAPKETVAKKVAGETITLDPQEHKLLVRDVAREYVGTVEPKLGLRLLRLIRGGNRYDAAIAAINDQGIRIIIKETYQHPTQVGRMSFPARGQDSLRASILEGSRYGLDEEEESTADEAEEWLEERGSDLEDVPEYKQLRGRSRRRSEFEEEEEF